MSESSSEINPLDRLAEEFVERYRRGERPPLSEYTERHPELADEIRELFPGLVLMEGIRPEAGDPTGAYESLPSSGRRLDRLGDYRILRQVGRGGMGVVYEAEQESLGRHVALKVLSADALLDPQRLQRFRREARAAARLHHTNIVPVFGVGEGEGRHYYVMQFIQGQGLNEVLTELRHFRDDKVGTVQADEVSKRMPAAAVAQSLWTGEFAAPLPESPPPSDHGRPAPTVEPAPSAPVFPSGPVASSTSSGPARMDRSTLSDRGWRYWQGVARLGFQAAEALAYAHGQGILHRDIKPSNLLLDTRGTVWVADFGLAKAVADDDDLTRPGDIVGTVRYMAPERFQGRSDARCDIYSLGLTLYELLTLQPAFDSTDRSRLIAQVMHDEPVRPRLRNPEVPRDLETIVLKAMDRDPGRRYQTARELAADLERFLEDRPIRARRVTRRERLWRWCRRNPALAVVCTLAIVSLLGVALLAALFALHESRAAAELAHTNADLVDARKLAENNFEASQRNLAKVTEVAGDRRRTLEQTARLTLTRGVKLCEEGDVPTGLLWIARSLEIAPADSAALQRLIRLSLTAWRSRLSDLRSMIATHGNYTLSRGQDFGWSRDGKVLLTRTGDGWKTVQLWDVTTDRPLGKPLPHPEMVVSADLSPDGSTVLTGGFDKMARFWDVRTGRLLGAPLPHPEQVKRVQFSPDGRTAQTWAGETRLWRVADHAPLGLPLLGHGTFSPDGKVLIVNRSTHQGRDQMGEEMRFLNTATGQLIGEPFLWKHPQGSGFTWSSYSERHNMQWGRCWLRFSPDGKTLLTWDASARLWDPSGGKFLVELGPVEGSVACAAFSPDGSTIVTAGSDGKLRFWEGRTGRPAGEALAFPGPVTALAYSPAGEMLVTANLMRAGEPRGELHCLDPRTRKARAPTVALSRSVGAIKFSPSGKAFLTFFGDRMIGSTFQLWDAAGLSPLTPPREHLPHLHDADFSPDGATLRSYTGDGLVCIWGVPAGSPTVGETIPSQAVEFRFSADSRHLWTVGWGEGGQRIDRWQIGPGIPRGQRFIPSAYLDAAQVCSGGTTFLTVQRHHTLHRWETATGRPLPLPLPPCGPFTAVLWSPDGSQLVTVGRNGHELRFWDAASGREAAPPLSWDGAFSGRSLTFSADGQRVAIATSQQAVLVCKASNGQVIRRIVQDGWVSRIALSPDGRVLLTASQSGDIQRWDVETGKALGAPLPYPVTAPGGVTDLAFSADGGTILGARSVGSYGALRHEAQRWATATGKPLGKPVPLGNIALVSFHPRGDAVLTVVNTDPSFRKPGVLVQWRDLASGQPRGNPLRLNLSSSALTLSLDRKWLWLSERGPAAPGEPPGEAGFRCWDVETLRPVEVRARSPEWERLAAVSPDGKQALTESPDFSVRLLDAVRGETLGQPLLLHGFHPNGGRGGMGWHFRVCAASPDGQTVLLREEKGKGLELWSTRTGQRLGRLPPPEPAPSAWACYLGPTFSPAGTRVLTTWEASRSQYELRAWDARSAAPLGPSLKGVTRGVFSSDEDTALLRQGQKMVAEKLRTELRFWSAKEGRLLGQPMTVPNLLRSLAFSPDGRIAAAASYGTNPKGQVNLWRVPSGEPIGAPMLHPQNVSFVTFSPDGKLLLTVNLDRQLRLWDVATGKVVGGPIQSDWWPAPVFSPDGKLFAASASRGSASRLTQVVRTPRPVEGEVERIVLWVKILTGKELDADGEVHLLDFDDWQRARRELQRRGGSPEPDTNHD
jgi:WD40 repeat protein/serine/threonine protein kinase